MYSYRKKAIGEYLTRVRKLSLDSARLRRAVASHRPVFPQFVVLQDPDRADIKKSVCICAMSDVEWITCKSKESVLATVRREATSNRRWTTENLQSR